MLREEIEEIKKNNPTRFSYMYTIDRPEEGWNYEKGFINQGNHFQAKESFQFRRLKIKGFPYLDDFIF